MADQPREQQQEMGCIIAKAWSDPALKERLMVSLDALCPDRSGRPLKLDAHGRKRGCKPGYQGIWFISPARPSVLERING
jgi:hypothetical protein